MRSTPVAAPAANGAERPSERKSHRHAQRELLYTTVREAMIRAGVLSASYKFKVLSLDPRGEQFMVMMDLAAAFGDQMERLTEIEVMIAQSAKQRYNIRVTAVYWRMNEMVSVGQPAAAAQAVVLAAPVFTESDLDTRNTLSPEDAGVTVQQSVPPRFEPLHADELAAFKQAVAAAQAATPPEKGAATRSSSRSYTLLTGFEDTEMADSPSVAPALSATQYGDLT